MDYSRIRINPGKSTSSKEVSKSATSASGGSEELPVSAEGNAESGNNSSVAENTDNDAQPTTKLISKIQAFELLATLIQFVPNEYSEGSAVAEKNGVEAGNNAEIGDIKILSQFKLRYLCRRFKKIIHRGLPLKLNLTTHGGRPKLCISGRFGIKVSHYRADDEICGLVSSSLKAITQPYDLSLSLWGSSARAVKCFVKDFGIRFLDQFPDVTLTNLRLESISYYATDCVAANRDCLIYFLSFSSQSLVQLHVDLRSLSSAFAPRSGDAQLNLGEDPTNVCVASLSPDWACNSLRVLSLGVVVDDDDYDYSDATLRAAAHADFSRLPGWFPNITKMSFKADRPQIDFAVLNQFAALRKFTLDSGATSDDLRADSNIVPLANIESFRFESTADFPLNFKSILPNVKKFKLVPQYRGAFADLANEVATVGNTFQLLQKLVVKQRLYLPHLVPPFRDLVRLIRSLDHLHSLVRLKVDFPSDDIDHFPDECSPPGDLSLVLMLPKKLTHA